MIVLGWVSRFWVGRELLHIIRNDALRRWLTTVDVVCGNAEDVIVNWAVATRPLCKWMAMLWQSTGTQPVLRAATTDVIAVTFVAVVVRLAKMRVNVLATAKVKGVLRHEAGRKKPGWRPMSRRKSETMCVARAPLIRKSW